MVELVKELEKLSDTPLRDRLVLEALLGSFHDYRSKSVCGKAYFLKCSMWFKDNIGKLLEDTSEDISKIEQMERDIKNGEYDEKYTKEDSLIVIEDIKKDPTISEKDKLFFIEKMKFKGQ